jgi:deoxyribodipyrimidine photo-lyase
VSVLDEVLLRDAGTPNRMAFLLDSLRALRASLRELGGDLVVRRGDVVAEVTRVASATGAKTLFVGDDVSLHARRRLRRLREQLDVRVESTVTVVAPGGVVPEGRDHYRVFTPSWRRWRKEPRAPVLDAPPQVTLLTLDAGRMPYLSELVADRPSPDLPKGGEGEGRRLERWLADGAADYDALRDDLAADATSHLSPYLHLRLHRGKRGRRSGREWRPRPPALLARLLRAAARGQSAHGT